MQDEESKQEESELEEMEEESSKKPKKWLKPLIYAGVSLALVGIGIGTGFGIWGGKRYEKMEVKPISELVSTAYFPKRIEISIGQNPYGARENIIHVEATDGREEISFSIYEENPYKFSELVGFFESIKGRGAFKLLDPLERNTGYPKDYRRALDLRIERSAEGKPVYILSGDDIIFYRPFKQGLDF